MISCTDKKLIHVRLLDEPILVWRPVLSEKVDRLQYRILDQNIPQYEEWEFNIDDIVEVEKRDGENGQYFVAVRKIE